MMFKNLLVVVIMSGSLQIFAHTEIPYVIRKGTLEDAKNLKQLYQRVAAVPGSLVRTPEEITDAYINDLLENCVANGLILVVEYEGRLIGAMSKHKFKVQKLSHVLANGGVVVDPQFQRKGIGTDLITCFLGEIEEHRPDILRVDLIVRESSPAIKLYERMGFKKEGRFEKRAQSLSGGFEDYIPFVWFNPNFRVTVANDVYQQIKKLPKSELHIHLGGAFPIEYLRTIATPEEIAALEAGLDKLHEGMEYKDAFFVFGLISKLVNNNQKIEDGTFALCKWLQADGVEYVEIRTSLKKLDGGYAGYLDAVVRGIERAKADMFKATILLSLQRDATPEYARATVDLAINNRDRGVVGIDISGDSTKGDIIGILPIILEAKQAGLKIVLHIGESPLETDQLMLLETLQPDRVGHAVHLKPEAYAWIMAHKTPIEVCLTSAEYTLMVDHHIQHPGIEYYRAHHPILICTDDPLIFRVSLTDELLLLHDAGLLTLNQVKELARSSFLYAFDN